MSRVPGAILGLSFVGMVDTMYLSLSRASGPIPCHITEGCGDVLNSVYSEVAGMPLSWFGLAFYVGVFSAAVFEVFGGQNTLGFIFWPSAAAFLTSAILTGIQIVILKAYCEYCLTSAGLSTAIFFLVLGVRRTSYSLKKDELI